MHKINIQNWQIFAFLFFIYFALNTYFERDISYGAGIVVPNEPVQTPISLNSTLIQNIGNYQLTPLANFKISARVLSKKEYSNDQVADLSPVDLALGWGRMSDEAILDDISINQRGRFYYWRSQELPIPIREIEEHSTNVHIIPANGEIRAVLRKIRVGHIVNIEGYLVNVTRSDGLRWISSLTRSDTGNGACEIIYVTSVQLSTP